MSRMVCRTVLCLSLVGTLGVSACTALPLGSSGDQEAVTWCDALLTPGPAIRFAVSDPALARVGLLEEIEKTELLLSFGPGSEGGQLGNDLEALRQVYVDLVASIDSGTTDLAEELDAAYVEIYEPALRIDLEYDRCRSNLE